MHVVFALIKRTAINMYSQTSGLPFCERNLFEDICDLNAPVEDPGFAEDFKSTIPSESVGQ